MSNAKKTQSVKDKIKAAKLPEKTVQICLHNDLQAEFERLDRELAEARNRPDESLAGTGAREIAEKIEALREQMRDHTVEFRMRARPRPEWKALIKAHPPRHEADGSLHEDDKYIGVNTETFYEALVRASVVEPELDEEDWAALLDEALTDRQFNDLAEAAWSLNRREVKVPFSHAASRTLNSDSE